MESITFLKDKLFELHNACPYLNIKYEFKEIINTHLIHVCPSTYFKNDDKYVECQLYLEDIFEEKFPYEDILFITDNKLIQIENPLLVYESTELEFNENQIHETIHYVIDHNVDSDYGVHFVNDYVTNYVVNVQPEVPWWKSFIKSKKDSQSKAESFFFV